MQALVQNVRVLHDGTLPVIPEENQYVDKERPWINGIVDELRVTLLADITVETPVTCRFERPTSYETDTYSVLPGNDYDTLVLRLKPVSEKLQQELMKLFGCEECHAPYITLCYMKCGSYDSLMNIDDIPSRIDVYPEIYARDACALPAPWWPTHCTIL